MIRDIDGFAVKCILSIQSCMKKQHRTREGCIGQFLCFQRKVVQCKEGKMNPISKVVSAMCNVNMYSNCYVITRSRTMFPTHWDMRVSALAPNASSE